MTRARERLLLSGAVDFERWPQPGPGAAPIAWLAPALSPELPARSPSARRERTTCRRGERRAAALRAQHVAGRGALPSASPSGRAADRCDGCARRPARSRRPRERRDGERRATGARRRAPGSARASPARAPARPRRAQTRVHAGAATGDAQLHLAERARALRLSLLPGTRARPARGPRRRAGRGCARAGLEARARGHARAPADGAARLRAPRAPPAQRAGRRAARASSGCGSARRARASSRR